jgi:hypothetical protein
VRKDMIIDFSLQEGELSCDSCYYGHFKVA